MSVNTQHRNFKKYAIQNRIIRDVLAGDEDIKANSKLYVPKLDGQDDSEYSAYINRAVFQNFTGRTLDGMTGLIFAKSPQIELGTQLTTYSENIDLDSSTLIDLAQVVVSEVSSMGRVGLLVDLPNINTEGMTQAQVDMMNIRPYIKIYKSESIINWRTETINNVTVLSMLVLYETYDKWLNEFESESIGRYRVYSLQDGICTVRVYEKNEDTFVITASALPMMNGKQLESIPFISITPDNLTIEPTKSPLYDISIINLNYFYTDVEYSHGCHFTALPTAYVAGHQMAQGESIKLGSTSAHVFQNPQARMEFLEFKGDGLQTLERKMESSKQSMAVLGARMLQPETAQIAENTMAMRTSGERAIIISIADTCSRGIKKALEIMAMWSNDNGAVEFKLNTDYNLTTMDAQTLTALVTSWQMGALSERELFINMQKGELIGEDVTFEDHQGEIEASTPAMSVTPTKESDNTDNGESSLIETLRTKLGL